MMAGSKALRRHDNRIIIHFDYDCFYASVFENENPALKSVPLAVQQKQIIVTCNYEARRRGLHKLELITDAKKACPDVVIVLGEELGRFRDASKALYKFLESYSWNGKVERLGFDEVFMDVTDIVDFNQVLLNPNDLRNSFFQLKRDDPTIGFSFDATEIAGHKHPSEALPSVESSQSTTDSLLTRLLLGSHLAQYLRWKLEDNQGYTSTVGISTNKLLSKLVGNLNKPKGQTTLMPPYTNLDDQEMIMEDNVTNFIDSHDIGKIPGIGFKMSQKIRNHVLSRPANFDTGLIYGGTKETVTVKDVRIFPTMCPELLEEILGGPGSERGIGGKAWGLINGVDNTEVQQAKRVPTQISIEDSYIRLDTIPEVLKELRILATSLIKRLHIDLLEDEEDTAPTSVPDSLPERNLPIPKRWIAYPRTIRLSTRPRLPINTDGTRTRSFKRISRSGPLPSSIFNLKDNIENVAEKVVLETLLPMFRRLHPYPSGWNLSLVNIGVTNMIEVAGSRENRGGGAGGGGAGGRDISRMFKVQEEVLKEWKVEDRDIPPDIHPDFGPEQGPVNRTILEEGGREKTKADEKLLENEADTFSTTTTTTTTTRTDPSAGNDVHIIPNANTTQNINTTPVEAAAAAARNINAVMTTDMPTTTLHPTKIDEYEMSWDDDQTAVEDEDDDDDDEVGDEHGSNEKCHDCGAVMPSFAMAAHERFHMLEYQEYPD